MSNAVADPAIDAVAKAICESAEADKWDELSEDGIVKALYRQQAQAAITAYRGVTVPEWDADDLKELRRMVPDLNAVLTHNAIHRVYLRAGLLACRETMARFVEQGGSDIERKIAISIRANWWPSLGPDPGPPRQLRYDEIADEKPDGRIDHKDMDPGVEALPFAYGFMHCVPKEPLSAESR